MHAMRAVHIHWQSCLIEFTFTFNSHTKPQYYPLRYIPLKMRHSKTYRKTKLDIGPTLNYMLTDDGPTGDTRSLRVQ